MKWRREKQSLLGGYRDYHICKGNQDLVWVAKWRKHLKNLRILEIKLMSYQEFQRAHWKDLKEKRGVEDCSGLEDIKIHEDESSSNEKWLVVQKQDFVICRKDYSAPIITLGSGQKSMKGEKRDLRFCDRNAKQEKFRFTQRAWRLNREVHFQYYSLLVESYSKWSTNTPL